MMIFRMTVLALLVLSSAAAGDDLVVYGLPPGSSTLEMTRRLHAFSAWDEIDGAESLARAIGNMSSSDSDSSASVKLRFLESLDDVQRATLDAIVRHCYERYRRERLPELGKEIEANRAEFERARRHARAVRNGMEELFRSGEGVLDREKAQAANAERIEELRRRTVDAGIEVAVLDARLRALRDQVAMRRVALQEVVLAPLRALKKRLIEEVGLGPNHARLQEVIHLIRKAEAGAASDDEEVNRLRRRIADLEVEQIATEERIKALSVALRSVRELGVGILRAVDLDEFRSYEVTPAEAGEQISREALDRAEVELKALKSDAVPKRLSVARRR